MHSPKLDSNALSHQPDPGAQPSSTNSSPKKKKSPKTSAPPNQSQQTIGLESSKEKSLSANGNGSSSRSTLVPADKEKKAQAALRRLKVNPEDLARCPTITPILKGTRGGLRALLKAMRFASEDPDISKFLEVYDKIPADDVARIPWEAICLAAEINPKHLCGAAQVAAVTFFGNTSRMVAVSSHPAITKARVRYALMPSGEKDRNALDVMVGALPSAKGPTFIGKAVFGGGGSQSSDDEEDEGPVVDAAGIFGPDDDISDIFPPAKEIQERIIPVRQRLGAGEGK